MKTNSYQGVRLIYRLIAAVMLLAVALPGPVAAAPVAQGSGFLPVTAKNACHDQRSPNVFGVQLYGSVGNTSPYFPLLQNSGTSWVRVPVYWKSVEPTNTTPDNFSWGAVDSALRVAQDSCANVIATVEGAPSWAATYENGPIHSGQIGEFVQFMQAMVERYDGDGHADAPSGVVVNYWELYNEPDAGPMAHGSTRWGNAGEQYAAMLKEIYGPVKSANFSAQVVMGGIAYDNFVERGGPFIESFLDDVLNNHGGQYFDIMNFHYYPGFKDDWIDGNQRGLPVKTAHIREKLAAHNLDKPIVITEAGWHNDSRSEQFPSSDEEQSRYVVQLFAQSIAANVQVMIWWALFDLADYPFANGLVTNAESQPPQPKPAYRVFQTAARRLASAEYHGMLSSAETQDPDLEVYQFVDAQSGKRMYVAWLNPEGTEQTRLLSRPGSVAAVYGKDNVNLGVVRDGDDGAQDGSVTIHVGSSPVYIVMD